jgi:predicted molibdopterin-dependent oxidoreductase YjgC
MTRNSGRLVREYPEALLEINKEDATALQVRDGEKVDLFSRRGKVRIKTCITDRVQPGTVFSSFHFFEVPINQLTTPAMDPKSKCPEFKVCSVNVRKVHHD